VPYAIGTTGGRTTIGDFLLQPPGVGAVQTVRGKKPASGWGDYGHPERQGADEAGDDQRPRAESTRLRLFELLAHFEVPRVFISTMACHVATHTMKGIMNGIA
jgi:hypothetical protein